MFVCIVSSSEQTHCVQLQLCTTHGIPFFVVGTGKFSCTFCDTTSWNYVNQDDILTICDTHSPMKVPKCIQPLLHIPGDEAVTDVKQQRQYGLTLGSLHSNF